MSKKGIENLPFKFRDEKPKPLVPNLDVDTASPEELEKALLVMMIVQLPENLRHVFDLQILYHKSGTEIAEILELTPGGVTRRKKRGIKKLIGLYQKYADENDIKIEDIMPSWLE